MARAKPAMAPLIGDIQAQPPPEGIDPSLRRIGLRLNCA
jgi:hypothetical protein